MAKVEGPSGRLVEATPVDFDAAAEPWTILELEDGTVLKLRVPYTGITRLEGEHDAVGNPVYVVSNAPIVIRIAKVGKGLRGEPTVQPGKKPATTAAGPEVR